MGELYQRPISMEEIKEAVKEMNWTKAPGLNGFPLECSKKGGMTVRMVMETAPQGAVTGL